jgi:hypothetical protein
MTIHICVDPPRMVFGSDSKCRPVKERLLGKCIFVVSGSVLHARRGPIVSLAALALPGIQELSNSPILELSNSRTLELSSYHGAPTQFTPRLVGSGQTERQMRTED